MYPPVFHGPLAFARATGYTPWAQNATAPLSSLPTTGYWNTQNLISAKQMQKQANQNMLMPKQGAVSMNGGPHLPGHPGIPSFNSSAYLHTAATFRPHSQPTGHLKAWSAY